jgi:hypothetical protein
MPPGHERILQDVSDISSADQLIRYAAAGQLERLISKRPDAEVSQARIALAAGLGNSATNAAAALSTGLRSHLTTKQIQGLDEIIGALEPDLDGTGGLCSLALRLSAERRGGVRGRGLTAQIPSSWTGRILKDPPGGEVGVLMQASALLSAFRAADKMHADARSVASIRERYRDELGPLVHRLILIAVGPPTSRNYDAQILLGMLASYAFDERMKQQLDYQLKRSPLGFRVWRAITKLVMFNARSSHTEALKFWVRGLIHDSENLRGRSLYAGRSLDLELAITVPDAWSPPDDDWVGAALLRRAKNPKATIRERGTAVMGLWQRAITEKRSDLRSTEAELRELIVAFRERDARPDAAAGLRWIAALLEQAIEQRVPVCNDWPDIQEPWFRNVQAAADELDILYLPKHLRTGAKNLFKHMILQNRGAYRRQAIETVVTSCWTEPVARALGHLLENEREESWIRIRALFALSFLQSPGVVEDDLTNGCVQAYENLELGPDLSIEPVRTRITEMHAALFAVGDCFGVPGAEDHARDVRDGLRSILTDLATAKEPRAGILHRATRAAAYMLILTAQPREGGRKDLSQELLEVMCHHPDQATASLSRWALSFRFAPDGTIRPLLAAAERRQSNGLDGTEE